MKKKILIVGLGASGSHTLLACRNLDVNITVVDFDTVESKNVLSQMHGIVGVGKKKTTSVRNWMTQMFGKGDITTINTKVTHDSAPSVIGRATPDHDLVIDCTDNKLARDTLSKACAAVGTDLLHVGITQTGDFAMIAWDENFTSDQEEEGVATCEDGENLPFHILVGAQTAIVVQQYLKTGTKSGAMINPIQTIKL